MAVNRDYFRTAMIKITRDGEDNYYKFAYASITPVFVAMNKATLVPWVAPPLEPGFDGYGDVVEWDHHFSVDHNETCYSDEGTFDAPTFHCLGDVSKRPNGLHCTNDEWTSLEDLRRKIGGPAYPREPDDDAETATRQPAKVPVKDWMTDPFMWEYVKEGGETTCNLPCKVPAAKRGRFDDNDEQSDSDDFDSDDDVEAMTRLWKKRAIEEDGRDDERAHFDWMVRGGRWTLHHVGVAFDSYMATAKHADARRFATLYGMRPSSSFSIKKFLDSEWCVLLAKLWCSRMTFWYSLWLSQGAGAYRFTPADIASYEEPRAVVALQEGPAVVRARAGDVSRRATPRVG